MEKRKRWEPRKQKTPEEVFRYNGKVPPQAIDLETSILGALILEGSCGQKEGIDHIVSVMIKVKPYHFYKEAHQLICEAILALWDNTLPVDMLTVTEKLRDMGSLERCGGAYYITLLTNRVASSANIEYWFHILYQKYILREIIRVSTRSADQAYEPGTDCFDLHKDILAELEAMDPRLADNIAISSASVTNRMLRELDTLPGEVPAQGPSPPPMSYQIGWPRFDEFVTISRNTMILIAGAASSGKSRFTRAIMRTLLERYAEVSICWISLEDSKEDIIRSFVASKIHVKPKHLRDPRSRSYPGHLREQIRQLYEQFRLWDVEFIDDDITSKGISNLFMRFCQRRPERFNILVIDNIMSLGDVEEFRHELNNFYDTVMHELRRLKQKTHGLIIPVHHFNDAQQDKANLKTGYRPTPQMMKGTEAFRRVPNQVLLVNSFNIYKDLMAEYNGVEKEVLKNLFIVDTGKNRDDSISDKDALIHFFCDFACEEFSEIPLPTVEEPLADYPADPVPKVSVWRDFTIEGLSDDIVPF